GRGVAAIGRRRYERLPSCDWLNRGRYSNRRPHIALAHQGGRKRIGPLLFLQVGDGRRVLFLSLLGISDGQGLISADGGRAEVLAGRTSRSGHDQRPAIASGRWECALYPERARTERF